VKIKKENTVNIPDQSTKPYFDPFPSNVEKILKINRISKLAEAHKEPKVIEQTGFNYAS
jgi:hypothetical protein